jgi:hypothetical protein
MTSSEKTIDGVLAEASRTAGRGSDLALAAGQVIAKRVALGVAAAMDPMQADHGEFARIVPEKVEAFSAAGMAVLAHSDHVGRQVTRLMSDEVMTTARATIAMAGCFDPATLVQAQAQFAMAWFGRAASNMLAMGMLALRAQDAAMAPILRTVSANADRLGR